MKKYSFKGWKKSEYIDFIISLGSVWSVTLLSVFLTYLAFMRNIRIPGQVYSIPIGFFIFSCCWIFDSIIHRTIYKSSIDDFELKIHDIMVYFSGFPLFVSFILAYWWPNFMLPFIGSFLFNKTLFSIIDEAYCHTTRYKEKKTNLMEIYAHVGQFLGNVLLDIGFIYLIYWDQYNCVRALFQTF